MSSDDQIYDYIVIGGGLGGIISCFILLNSYLFAEQILTILEPNFIQFIDVFLILMIGITSIYVIRGLFGNLLSSIGKAHINHYIASISLIINIISNYFLIPKYGIKGAAITSAILMWFSSLLSLICFLYLYKNLLIKRS
jgi:Na+-driven multidrug efflux pump